MSKTIEILEQRQLRKDLPRFKAGDTVRVHFQVIEGQRRRVQVFEGIVIKRQGAGVRETFTVRKQSFGVGVERTFPLHSPKIEKIEVDAIGDVNRAKLYYLRDKVGKKARVRAVQRRDKLKLGRCRRRGRRGARRGPRARRRARRGSRRRGADDTSQTSAADVEPEPAAEAEAAAEAAAEPRSDAETGSRSSLASTAGSAHASSRAPTRPAAARSRGRSSSRACCSTTTACATTASARSRS